MAWYLQEGQEGILPQHVQDVDSDGFDVEQLQPLVSKQWDRGMKTVRF